MLLWPARPRETLRADAARACVALANLADSTLGGDRSVVAARARAARDAVDGLRARFLATPHRPTGPTGPIAALASLVDELDWLLTFLVPTADPLPLELCREENAEAMAAAIAVLRVSAARLDGRDESPDVAQLDKAREAVARALAGRIPELPQSSVHVDRLGNLPEHDPHNRHRLAGNEVLVVQRGTLSMPLGQ